MCDDAVNIAVLLRQKLMQPVDQFHIGVSPHFAKDGRAFDGLIPQFVELAKQGDTADLGHIRSFPLSNYHVPHWHAQGTGIDHAEHLTARPPGQDVF